MKSYRTFARVCLRFLKYLLWYFCKSPMVPCSACIFPEPEMVDVETSLEILPLPDLLFCLFFPPLLDKVGDWDWTVSLFFFKLDFRAIGLDPSSFCQSSSTTSSISASSSWMSWRGDGCLKRMGASISSSWGGGGGGVRALPSAGAHQGKQHFQTPTRLPDLHSDSSENL